MLLAEELSHFGIYNASIELGQVEFQGKLNVCDLYLLDKKLRKSGLELMDDNRSILIEQIKMLINTLIYQDNLIPKLNLSEYILSHFKHRYNYTYLSNLFTEVNGITIQHYQIQIKIERVKELLFYNELNISKIAEILHYSSASHLSNQFKKFTGVTPSFFKQMGMTRSKNLEDM